MIVEHLSKKDSYVRIKKVLHGQPTEVRMDEIDQFIIDLSVARSNYREAMKVKSFKTKEKTNANT